jgi:hypothetical protein
MFRIRLELSTLNFQLSVVAIAPGSADILIGGSLVAKAKSLQSWSDFEGPSAFNFPLRL